MRKTERMDDSELMKDLGELCTCTVKAVIAIAKKHNFNPIDVSQMFLTAYSRIQSNFENQK